VKQHPPSKKEALSLSEPTTKTNFNRSSTQIQADIDAFVQEYRKKLVEAGHTVCSGDVINKLVQHFEVSSYRDFHVGAPWSAENSPLAEIINIERTINCSICSFLAANAICTLYSLECFILREFAVPSWEYLKMGPFLKYPMIIQEFRIPLDLLSVPRITISDVYAWISQYTHTKMIEVYQQRL